MTGSRMRDQETSGSTAWTMRRAGRSAAGDTRSADAFHAAYSLPVSQAPRAARGGAGGGLVPARAVPAGTCTQFHCRPRDGKITEDVYTSVYVWGDTEDQIFELGVEYEVDIELMFWNEYRHEIHAGMPLQLNQGARQVIGRGTILSIIGES